MPTFVRRALVVLAAVLVSLPVVACSGGQHTIRVSGPFTPDLGRFFDDAVDYVENVEGLGGRVASDWQAQIEGLSRNADLVGETTIETVVQGQDSDGSRSYRLSAVVANVVQGQATDDRRVQLRVSEGQGGFNTVNGKEERLQSGHYMLFVRWYTDAQGDVRAHWHLTPYSNELLARVRRASGQGTSPGERVIRQEGSGSP